MDNNKKMSCYPGTGLGWSVTLLDGFPSKHLSLDKICLSQQVGSKTKSVWKFVDRTKSGGWCSKIPVSTVMCGLLNQVGTTPVIGRNLRDSRQKPISLEKHSETVSGFPLSTWGGETRMVWCYSRFPVFTCTRVKRWGNAMMTMCLDIFTLLLFGRQ